ncbi:MFS transporter [Galactobacter caseinivorans]|uniref:MFS transporter n=2 Tax=Galactobacter caseinivorans TaxID=2676123 RepID=A0A496PI17_9MICC|nr:MFS transporter [Galactobacter caseinivorans]
MTHRQVLTALSGLLLGMFVSMIANTVVSTSMPTIVHDINGSQADYTWVITAALLATTVSTPIWGKLADLVNRKMLLQISLIIFVASSAVAGFSSSPEMLITMRVFQGLGGGGMAALSQIVMADIISPRERGRYMGLFGAVMAVGTVGGPLLGGWITDNMGGLTPDGMGWRWNFFVSVPFAVAALYLLQKTLHLPKLEKRKVSIDYLGIVFLGAGVSLLLIWVSMAGDAATASFKWASPETVWMTSGAAILLLAFVITELRVKEPLIDLGLFKNRTFTLAVVASISVGLAMFGAAVYLSQYMIMARGATPTMAGVMTIPMMAGLLIISTVVGALITRTGKWKRYVILGSALLTASLALLGTIHYDTNYWLVALYMFVMGSGLGMVMQNLVLVVQNAVSPRELGVASSAVTFFRSLGGTIGVSWLGAMLANRLPSLLGERQADLQNAAVELQKSDPAAAKAFNEMVASGQLPTPASMPETIRPIFEWAYGDALAHVFLLAAPLALVTLIAVIFLPNLSLSHQTRSERADAEQEQPAEGEPVLASPIAATGAAMAGSDTGQGALPDDAGSSHGAPLTGGDAAPGTDQEQAAQEIPTDGREHHGRHA